jgi:hypothetical protein
MEYNVRQNMNGSQSEFARKMEKFIMKSKVNNKQDFLLFFLSILIGIN